MVSLRQVRSPFLFVSDGVIEPLIATGLPAPSLFQSSDSPSCLVSSVECAAVLSACKSRCFMYVIGVLLRNPRLAACAAPLASTIQLAISCTETRLSARDGYDMKHSPSLVLILNWILAVSAAFALHHYSRQLLASRVRNS